MKSLVQRSSVQNLFNNIPKANSYIRFICFINYLKFDSLHKLGKFDWFSDRKREVTLRKAS